MNFQFLFLAVCLVSGIAAISAKHADAQADSGQGSNLRPLVLVHGMNSSYHVFDKLTQMVHNDYPNMTVIAVDAYNKINSYANLNVQVPVWARKIREITMRYGPITLLGYSQGGVVARAVIESSSNHDIHTFISLSAPANGQFGLTEGWKNILPGVSREDFFQFCYSNVALVSFCQYWNDPRQQERYLRDNKFLPRYNNIVRHKDSALFKENFSNLSRLVLAGGSKDQTIIPWQSAQFGFYNSEMEIVPYHKQQFYINDTFGLRTLQKNEKLRLCNVNTVNHQDWVTSQQVYEKCIRPWIV
jgi:palmitoyl-protein thioesterase